MKEPTNAVISFRSRVNYFGLLTVESLARKKKKKKKTNLKGSFYLSFSFSQWCSGGFFCGKEILLLFGVFENIIREKNHTTPLEKSFSNFDSIVWSSGEIKRVSVVWRVEKRKRDLGEEKRDYLCILMLKLSSLTRNTFIRKVRWKISYAKIHLFLLIKALFGHSLFFFYYYLAGYFHKELENQKWNQCFKETIFM